MMARRLLLAIIAIITVASSQSTRVAAQACYEGTAESGTYRRLVCTLLSSLQRCTHAT
jgi:hypothetical protein